MDFNDSGYCDECGNHGVERRIHGGQAVDECEFCGALYGNADVIKQIETEREADALGIDPVIFPLVRELDAIRGVRCYESTGGDPPDGVPPFANFHIGADPLKILETLLTSLSLARGRLTGHWHVEVLLHNGRVSFSLRPKLPPDLSRHEAEINRYQDDVATLAQQIESHKKLGWWKI